MLSLGFRSLRRLGLLLAVGQQGFDFSVAHDGCLRGNPAVFDALRIYRRNADTSDHRAGEKGDSEIVEN